MDEDLLKLRRLSQWDVQTRWHCRPSPAAAATVPPGDQAWEGWPLAAVNDRHQVTWPGGQSPLWLHQRLTWPATLGGYSIQGLSAKLALRWWAHQAEVYVNGELVHTGDLFDCWTRVDLTPGIIPGQVVEVSLGLLSPGHDDGALVQSLLVLESPDPDSPEPAFVADELAVLATYLAQFAPQHLQVLPAALGELPWEQVRDRAYFDQALARLRDSLQTWSPWIKQRTIHCLGHAHLDLAWLWPVAETWAAAQRTFESVLALQQEFPELTFTHSSPALFEWLEQHRPQLFQAIQRQVQGGRWAIDAGLWVEPDLNLPGGEALVRQILYGQRYCAEKFGRPSAIAWLPDTFGFSWQLPQLLNQGGVRFFATQKLRWNDTNPFPYDLFTWQGLDGTAVTAVTLPPIGTDLEPVAMAQYACQWEANTGLTDCLWLPGVGDHGGGPTRDMLIQARRWNQSPFFPTLTFGHAAPLFDTFMEQVRLAGASDLSQASEPATDPGAPPAPSRSGPRNPLPLWADELYLELHRGCYTTHGDQKQYNRRCEDLLFQAELFAAIAALLDLRPYPKRALTSAWKQALFNQFHDILPGSSIPAVFEQANQDWQAALAAGQGILRDSLAAIARLCPLPPAPTAEALPVLLFNPLNWPRSEVVSIPLPANWAAYPGWQAQDAWGHPLPSQGSGWATAQGDWTVVMAQSPSAPGSSSLLVFVPDIPAIGYRLIWITPTGQPPVDAPRPQTWVLENQTLRVVIDGATGNITSLWDQRSGTETFSGPGNQLQAFQDQGQYWDAWNIAPDYPDHPLGEVCLQAIEWIDYGPCRQTLRVVRTFNQSTFRQDYCLDTHSPVLVIRTEVDWQETQVLVKAAFPLTVTAPVATYEIPFGAIQRSTAGQTPQDQAKWEVPALRWADLTAATADSAITSQPPREDGPLPPPGEQRGVSLLTDYKHGFDATPNQLRLTLLKAPLWPDPTADRGWQTFTYALYPHPHSWQQAKTVQMARNLNLPIQPWPGLADSSPAAQTLPLGTGSFLDLGDNSLVVSAFKLAEENDQQFILRAYESAGQEGAVKFHSDLGLQVLDRLNLLEQPAPPDPPAAATMADPVPPLPGAFTAWQVVSWSVARPKTHPAPNPPQPPAQL